MSNTIVKMKTVDGELRSYDKSKLNEIEEVLTLRQHKAIPYSEKVARRFIPGDKYKVEGLRKAEGIMYGFTTLDLNAKIPVSKKRTVEDAELSKKKREAGKDGFEKMQNQIDELTAVVAKLTAAKK